MSLRIAITTAALALSLTACEVYHMPIQQGNIIDNSMINKVHKGMTSKQVIAKLGSPVLKTPFKSNELIYIYSLTPSEGEKLYKRLEITLKNSRVISTRVVEE